MKTLLLSFAALLVSVSAFAHVEPGMYKGTKADGSECSMVAGETYFEKETPHPLNERISIRVGEDAFVVGHPPVFQPKDSFVYFNHDVFQGILPTATGAKAIEIEMVHTKDKEGPVSFTFVENQWRAKVRSSYTCSGLQHQK